MVGRVTPRKRAHLARSVERIFFCWTTVPIFSLMLEVIGSHFYPKRAMFPPRCWQNFLYSVIGLGRRGKVFIDRGIVDCTAIGLVIPKTSLLVEMRVAGTLIGRGVPTGRVDWSRWVPWRVSCVSEWLPVHNTATNAFTAHQWNVAACTHVSHAAAVGYLLLLSSL